MVNRNNPLGFALGLLAVGAAGTALYRANTEVRRSRLHSAVRGALNEAAAVLGTAAPPLVRTPQVANAASNGTVILYNEAWVTSVLAKYCSSDLCRLGILLGVMAHELSHHAYGDVFCRRGDGCVVHPHEQELRADRVAGWVLAQAGFSPEDLARLLGDLSSRATHSHPDGQRRRQAIALGYWRSSKGFNWDGQFLS